MNYEIGRLVPPETEYLITDLEERVNKNYREFLSDAPYKIEAKGYRPELLNNEKPVGIDVLEANYLMNRGSFDRREFASMDLIFNFPLQQNDKSPWNITVKWSDGLQCRLAVISDLPLLFVEESGEGGHTLHSEILKPGVMSYYMDSLGLPSSLWEDDVKEITRDLYQCPEFFMTQSAKTFVDPYTSIELIHDAQIRTDIDDDKQLVYELVVNIDHLDQTPPTYEEGTLPLMPHMRFRNMLRFDRQEQEGLWKFKGSYHGKLNVGELIDDLVQIDPKLGIPGAKVLEKAFNGLEL